jgi:lactate permease
MVGRTLPVLSFLIPLYLVILMCGFRKAKEVLPAIFVSGFSFAFLQWLSSNYLGPALPDVIAGIGSIIALVLFLKFWKPKEVWRFPNEAAPNLTMDARYSKGQILRAWSPFIVMTIFIIAWGLQPIKNTLNSIFLYEFAIPGLHQAIADKNGALLPHIFKFNFLSASGTAIMLAALIAIPLAGLSFKEGGKIFLETLKQLRFPILTIVSVLGFAYIMNDSGMTITIADAVAHTGVLFPFFAPVLGWLGVFITGSDTSANALFSKLQAATATSIGVDPVVTVAANVSGGVVGKMISPQSIAVAAAAGNLVGKESELFRFTVKHSFIMLLLICCLVLAQAYLLKALIPAYQMHDATAAASVASSYQGYAYLLSLAVIIAVIVCVVMIMNKNKEAAPVSTEASLVNENIETGK